MSTQASREVRRTFRQWQMASTRNNQTLEDLACCSAPGLDAYWVANPLILFDFVGAFSCVEQQLERHIASILTA